MSAANASRNPERLIPASSDTVCQTSWLSTVRYAWMALRSSGMFRNVSALAFWLLYEVGQDFIKHSQEGQAASLDGVTAT
jgi:hypothetical protein